MNCWRIFLTGLLLAWVGHAQGAGSGLNVVVVVNQSSSNSVQLGNYYCERRQVPPQNVLRVNWAGSNIEWTKTDFQNVILTPLQAMLAARQLTNQIEYVVLSMDLPYRVVHTGTIMESGANSTTSALFYGFKPDFSNSGLPSCSLPGSSSNAYAGSEGVFRATPPISALSNSFLVTMLTSSNLAEARLVVDRAVASDNTFPTQTVFLSHGDDRLRNIRYWLFDDAIFNTRLRGNYSMMITNLNSPDTLGPLLGFQSGVQWAPLETAMFVPGSLADNLTSFSGKIFEEQNIPSHHRTALAFLNAGAAGSYGTVVEPCAYLQKFPSPQNYFYQSRGFSVAECYYQSVTNPHQGLLVGEPLAAPFALPAAAAWNNLPTNSLLSGTTNLSLTATAADPGRPVQQVDLFIDGMLVNTVTNIAPRQNNVLNVTVNGHSMNHTVPASASIKSVTAGLTSVLNQMANTNVTKVRAFAHGDRIELRSFDITKRGPQIPTTVSSSVGAASALTTHISASSNSFLDSPGHGLRSYSITNIPALGDFLQLTAIKTNGQTVTVAVTNTMGGLTLADFARSLFNAVNAHVELTSADGLVVEDINMHEDFPYNVFVYGTNDHSGEFNIRARSPGWSESQISVRVSGSPAFNIQPGGTNRLDENVTDLQPRQHLYITAGVTNLPLTFALNTTTFADGFHELTAVVYEGSHVRTQKRLSQLVKFENSPLSATISNVPGATVFTVDSPVQISVTANTNNISKIELFSTGGALTNVTGQSSATFAIAGTNLGVGLHPFYAVITGAGGKQYRTETLWIRLVGADSLFQLSISAPPSRLGWQGIPGATYEILSTDNITNAFQLRDSITLTNSNAEWVDPTPAPTQRFYRVRLAF